MGGNVGGNPAADGDEFKHSIGPNAFDHETYLVGVGIKQDYRFIGLVLCSIEVEVSQ
jgi:hypothetical protein